MREVPVQLSLRAERMNPHVIVDSNSKILVIMGGTAMGGPVIEIEIYDSETLTFKYLLN
jgi:hypothetical protein